MSKVKKTYRFTARIKGCPIEFKEGMGNGVVAIDEIEYEEYPGTFESCFFSDFLESKKKKLTEELFEVEVEEIPSD